MTAQDSVVAVDFDRVLFDTGHFYRVAEHITGYDMDTFKDSFESLYQEHGTYDIDTHAAELGIQPVQLEAVYKYAPNCLYADAADLAALREDHTVMLVTRQTHDGFQQLKVQASGVLKHVDDYRIVAGHPADEPKTVENAVFLADDRGLEHDHFDGPGLVVDRDYHGVQDIIDAVNTL